jgi:hypothetical protein
MMRLPDRNKSLRYHLFVSIGSSGAFAQLPDDTPGLAAVYDQSRPCSIDINE